MVPCLRGVRRELKHLLDEIKYLDIRILFVGTKVGEMLQAVGQEETRRRVGQARGILRKLVAVDGRRLGNFGDRVLEPGPGTEAREVGDTSGLEVVLADNQAFAIHAEGDTDPVLTVRSHARTTWREEKWIVRILH